MASIPDKWNQAIFIGGGGATSLVQPAPVDPSIVLIVTDISVSVFCAAVGAPYSSGFSVFDNAVTILSTPVLVAITCAAVGELSTGVWQGSFQMSPGSSMQVLGAPLPANVGAIMTASGYAI